MEAANLEPGPDLVYASVRVSCVIREYKKTRIPAATSGSPTTAKATKARG